MVCKISDVLGKNTHTVPKKTHFLSVAVPSERYLGQNYKYSYQNYSMHKLL